ncbi:MAG: hypothetical protein M3Q65_23570 [Chloroflexota bacterium]|nr:hypothetical protein [Chloroflexota bacterium]
MREIDVVAPPLIPFLYPERVLRVRQGRGVGRIAAAASTPAIPETRWSEIVARVKHEGLRRIARDFGVSHEVIRTVLQAAGRTDLLADAEHRYRLAAAAPPPPPAQHKIPKERYGEVVTFCQRHTQAEVAAMLGVSQATIWRIVCSVKARNRTETSCPYGH